MRRLLLALSASSVLTPKARWVVLRACGVDVQGAVREHCFFGSSDVSIGRATFVNRGCTFDGEVRIGARCAIGIEVAFISSTHTLGDRHQRSGPLRFEAITIGDGCWIGTRAMILPGVTVGDGVIIAAGAVVREDCRPHTLYAGVPARPVRELG